MKKLSRFLVPFAAFFAANSLLYFGGKEGISLLSGHNLALFGLVLLIILILFRFDSKELIVLLGPNFFYFISIFLFFVTSLYFFFLRISIYPELGGLLFDCLLGGKMGVIGLPSSEAERIEGSSRGSGWTTHDLDMLAESSSRAETDTTSSSVNKPEGEPPFPRTNASGDSAGPSTVSPFPFQEDEVIGGDCLKNVYRRLLTAAEAKKGEDLSLGEYGLIRYQAEDLFEAKVSIIRQMAPLDPEGDWDRRGAQALENSRTTTGEETLERLQALNADLEERGVQSEAFRLLKGRVFGRRFEDNDSET